MYRYAWKWFRLSPELYAGTVLAVFRDNIPLISLFHMISGHKYVKSRDHLWRFSLRHSTHYADGNDVHVIFPTFVKTRVFRMYRQDITFKPQHICIHHGCWM